MSHAVALAFDEDLLIDRLTLAVGVREPERITRRVKNVLEVLVAQDALDLPQAVLQPRATGYARRLLHRDPDLDFTVLVMAWGPGQGAPLHDHDGLWGVEIVVQGEMEVDTYELLESPEPFDPAPLAPTREAELHRFVLRETVRSGVGESDSLVPPREYHAIRNALPDATSVTLHVYGGELHQCNIYLPEADGLYRREPRRLSYDDWGVL